MSAGTRNKYKHVQSKVQSRQSVCSEIVSYSKKATNNEKPHPETMDIDEAERNDSAYSSFNANTSKSPSKQQPNLITNLSKLLSTNVHKPLQSKTIPRIRDPDILSVNEYRDEIISYLFKLEV